MTKYEKIMDIKNKAETDGRLGKISVAEAQSIVEDCEKLMSVLSVAELAEKVND